MVIGLLILIILYLVYLITFNVIYARNPETEELPEPVQETEDNLVRLKVVTNCTDPKSTYMTDCQPFGFESKCEDDARYSTGDFTCDSYKSCASRLGHRSVCQQKQDGLCAFSIAPSLSPIVGEVTTVEDKSCVYETEDVCSNLADYSFIYNFTDKVEGGKVEKGSMDKCTAHFCSLPAEGDCPIDPLTGEEMKKCSRFTVDGIEGAYCNVWLETKSEEEQAELFEDYCNRNPDSGDCACVSRAQDPEFSDVAGIMRSRDIKDECWWKACKDKHTYLVPPSMNHKKCKDVLCVGIDNTDKIDCQELTCDDGFYLDEENDECVECSKCSSSEIVKEECGGLSDTVCESKPTKCPSGSYSPSGDFSKCVKCSVCEGENLKVGKECTQTTNTVCAPIVDLTSTTTDALALLALGFLFLIFVVSIGFAIIYTSPKGGGKQLHPPRVGEA